MSIEETTAEKLTGKSVSQVPAFGQTQPQNLVARIDQRQIGGQVRVCAGVRLDVDMLGAEELLGSIDRQRFDHVDELAAAVIALAGIAFGIFVGENAADRPQHRGRDEILRSDQLDAKPLALLFLPNRIRDLRICGQHVDRGSNHERLSKLRIMRMEVSKAPALYHRAFGPTVRGARSLAE